MKDFATILQMETTVADWKLPEIISWKLSPFKKVAFFNSKKVCFQGKKFFPF